MSHRLHVLKIPTTRQSDAFEDNLFPYTHYADPGHDPRMEVLTEAGRLVLRCSDRMKLHPNYMTKPANRVDVYMPGTGAASLAVAIVAVTGSGDVAELADVDPEAARSGPQPVPYVREARRVFCSSFEASIAGCRIESRRSELYIDNEAPREGYIQMMGPEVHLAIRLARVSGQLDVRLVDDIGLWCPPSQRPGQSRIENSVLRPAPTANAFAEIRLDFAEGARLAACLLHYAKAHELELSSIR